MNNEPICAEDGCKETAVGSRPSAVSFDPELIKLVEDARDFVEIDELVCYTHLMGD